MNMLTRKTTTSIVIVSCVTPAPVGRRGVGNRVLFNVGNRSIIAAVTGNGILVRGHRLANISRRTLVTGVHRNTTALTKHVGNCLWKKVCRR